MTNDDSSVVPGENAEPVLEKNAGDTVRASWPFSLHQIRSNISHCSPEGKEALVSAFLWCTDSKHPIAKSEFARRVQYSENTIYRLLSGKYVDSETKRQLDVPDGLIKGINSFLELERERFIGGRSEFVLTPTAKRIWHGCDVARESRSPVFIWGPSQLGKTTALERYAHQNNHGRTSYCRIKAASGLGGLVRRVAERVGVSPNSNTSQLIDYIKGALTEDMVLILDEVHLLAYTYRKASFFACMEVIREFHDETHCGLVLCGTNLLEGELKAREMEQLLKRGVHRISLPGAPTVGDVTAILEKLELPFPERGALVTVNKVTEEPYALLRQLAKTSGFKAITERLRYAKKLASKAKARISWQYFIEAHLLIAAESSDKDGWQV